MSSSIPVLSDLVHSLAKLLPVTSTKETREDFKDWRLGVTAGVRVEGEQVQARENAFRDEVERVKNDLCASECLRDNRDSLVMFYVKYCLITPSDFIKKVLDAQPGSGRVVNPWEKMDVEERRDFIAQVKRRVEEACGLPPSPPQQHPVNQYRTYEFLPPVVAPAPGQPHHHQTAPSYRSHPSQAQFGAPVPQFQPPGNGYSTAMPQSVNTSYGSQHFQNYATTPGNPAGYGYNGSSSSVNPSASFAPAFSTGQQYQPPPSTHFQHPSHAHATPPSSAAAASPNSMDRNIQQLLCGDLPLVQACQRLILVADTAGISKPEEKEWFEKVRAAERQVSQAERWRLVHFVKVGTSAIEQIVDDCIKGRTRTEMVHGLAQEAMNSCLAAIEQLAPLHAGQTGQALRSLGSSHASHPFNRLSHRQRVIYGRTFSASAY